MLTPSAVPARLPWIPARERHSFRQSPGPVRDWDRTTRFHIARLLHLGINPGMMLAQASDAQHGHFNNIDTPGRVFHSGRLVQPEPASAIRCVKITVLGPGACTALAKIAHEGGHAVTLWGRPNDSQPSTRPTKIPITFPASRYPQLDARAQSLPPFQRPNYPAVPSSSFNEITKQLGDFKGIAVSVTKGIEHQTAAPWAALLKPTRPTPAFNRLIRTFTRRRSSPRHPHSLGVCQRA